MSVDQMVNAVVTEFKQNVERFCEDRDLSALTPDLAEQVASGLKDALAKAGAAGYRTFLKSYEEQADVVVAQGEVFRFKGEREKEFLTPFGTMVIPRRCYQNAKDTKGHVPLDAAWGMEGQYMAPQVREAVLFSCAHVTPEETAMLLKKSAMFTPHATAIKHVLENIGVLIEAQREVLDQAVRAQETAPENIGALVTSLDGATVLLNEKGMRFGRPAERPRGAEPRETSTSYRVAMVGSASFYSKPEAPGEAPQRLESRYVAQMPEERCPTFKRRYEAELDAAEAKAPPGTARILLLDGARELWYYLDNNPRFDGYHKCIDFWHVLEHLSKAAEALFGEDKDAAEKWYDKYSKLLRESDDAAQAICRSMEYYKKRNRMGPARQKHLREELTYFTRNGKRMPYATFIANSWPIGSGPIEAACKTLVKTRLCRSGMRWSREGGQRVLALRTYVKSNRWDLAWAEIKRLKPAV